MAKEYTSRIHFASQLLMVFFTIIYAIPAYASSMPPPDVIKEAQVFVPNAVYKYATKGTYVFGRNGNYVFVDAKTQRVNWFTWPSNPIKGKGDFDMKTAETRVRVFLKDRRIDLSEWILLRKIILSPVHNQPEHNFTFGKKTPDGMITLPSFISISMDSDGNFTSYTYKDSPVTISLEPTYSKDQLLQIAFKATKQKNPKLKSYRLYVADRYENIRKQMLLAEIWVRGEPRTKITDYWATDQGFIINAHTGEIISTMGIAAH